MAHRSSRKRRPRQHHRLQLERLECRLALNAAPVLDLSNLAFDPNAYDPHSVIVRFDDAGGDPAGAIIDGAVGHSLLDPLPALQRVTLPDGMDVAAALAIYRSDPRVVYAEPNYVVRLQVIPDDESYAEMWGLENTGQTGGTPDADIDAPAAWDVTTGSSQVLVAVIDTGIAYGHPDLAANIWVNPGEVAGDNIDNDGNGYVDDIHGYDFVNDDGDPMDDNGHGTHVAGTIGAVGDNSIGVTGINWSVTMMAVKVFAADGNATNEDVIEGIYYAVANGAVISNNSWGGNEPFSQAMYDAVTAARDAGHIFVAGAGNGDFLGIGMNNDEIPFYPAAFDLDNVVAVAATDHDDDLAPFSNYGPTSVDLAAPGVLILSTYPGDQYNVLSGTSMATPHVTGVLALVKAQHPEWTYDQVIQQVLSTVDPLLSLEGLVVTGGRLNAAAALGNPEPPPPPPPPVTLPILEDFADGVANSLLPQQGNWDVTAGRYDVSPVVDDDEVGAVTIFNTAGTLPEALEIRATVNADEGHIEVLGFVLTDYLSNGFIVFDYQSPTDFKFAGPDMVQDRWIIGQRTASGWVVDAFASQTLDVSTDYDLKVTIDGGAVSVWSGGVLKVSHTYSGTLNDGKIGLGVRNSSTHFDNLLVLDQTPPTPGTLPLSEDFSDGVADHFQNRDGIGNVVSGRYEITTFAGQDGVQTLLFSQPLPANVRIESTINANNASGAYLSNAFIIFDYHGPHDFKFAGAYAGVDQWVIGHRTAADWVTDAFVSAPINGLTDYGLRLDVESSGLVSLYVDDAFQVRWDYAASVTGGEVGLGTKSAIARFDDLSVASFTPQATGSLPVVESFGDGVADFFEVRAGSWNVADGRYSLTPTAGLDGISTLRLPADLPGDLEVKVTINADAASGSFLSNSFIIFDYQGPTNFKFAGAYVGVDQWVIGHRDASGWVTDVYTNSVIDPNTDYQLRLKIENDSKATLFVGGVPRVSFTFGGELGDGAVGLGTKGAISRFDDVDVRQIAANPPSPGSLPLSEDFQDGVANSLQIRFGDWTVFGGKFIAAPAAGQDAISTVLLSQALPSNLELKATINAEDASATYLSNGFLLFDYVGPTDFKFAGFYAGADQWVIGHRDASGWVTDAFVSAAIDPLTDYALRLLIEEGNTAILFANGQQVLFREYGESLVNGQVGLGTKNGVARFDNLEVREFTLPGATLPVNENFGDGVADFFQPRAGTWAVASGVYGVTPATGQDAVSTLRLAAPLPDAVEFLATVNANAGTADTLSNAFIIFDYQSATNFKFAGAYTGVDQWVIGHRDASGWVTDAFMSYPLDALTDYNVRLVITGGTDATLFVGGAAQVTFHYTSLITDGKVGLGTKNGISRFDNVQVRAFTGAAAASLPYQDSFNDGIADHFLVRQGTWSGANSRFAVTPAAGQDAIATVVMSGTLPNNLELQALVNANAAGSGFLSNAVVIFDYVSPTDFKFAGAYAGVDQWVIGHRTASGWSTDAFKSATIDALTDYNLRVVIQNGTTVSLYAGGAFQVSYTFSASVVDGQVGLGSQNAIARFDDFALLSGGGLTIIGSSGDSSKQVAGATTLAGPRASARPAGLALSAAFAEWGSLLALSESDEGPLPTHSLEGRQETREAHRFAEEPAASIGPAADALDQAFSHAGREEAWFTSLFTDMLDDWA